MNIYFKYYTESKTPANSGGFCYLITLEKRMGACDALCDLVSFVQFKKREKHPWRFEDN